MFSCFSSCFISADAVKLISEFHIVSFLLHHNNVFKTRNPFLSFANKELPANFPQERTFFYIGNSRVN